MGAELTVPAHAAARRAAFGLAATLCTSLALAGPARADTVTFEVTGQVTAIADPLVVVPDLSLGTPYVATYSFESTTEDADPVDPRTGLYPQDAGTFLVSMGDADFVCLDPDLYEIELFDAGEMILGEEADEYVAAASGCGPFAFDTTLELVQLSLIDPDQTALSSDALLVEPPDLSSWDPDLSNLLIAGCPDTNPACDPVTQGFSIAASVDEIVFAPEPGLAALQGAALVAVGLIAGSRRRAQSSRSG